jgi:hypothetical protein
MEVLLNELSLYGQFSSVSAFQSAIDMIMLARGKIRQFGGELRCHRNLTQVKVTHELRLQQVILRLDRNKRGALMSWLTKEGPFWEDSRQHDSNEYFAYQDDVVTDSAIGEAAYQCANDGDYHVLSFAPSNWQFSPIPIKWHREHAIVIDIMNHWDMNSLESALQVAAPPIRSWQQLAKDMQIHCPSLTFSENSFESLYSHPFVNGAAKRIVELLKVLDKFKTCFDENGCRTAEGHHLYQEHFTGDKVWFSDSSPSEKNVFKSELTFKNPNDDTYVLFCTWHGKIKTPQFRIHFSWPITVDSPLYVPYIGPKITKS